MDLTRIQAYLRTAASRTRETGRFGPLLATFSADTDHPYLSYAIPDDGAEPSPADVAALIAGFGARERTPRVEYLPAVAPAAEAALLAGGFTLERRIALMVAQPGDAPDLAPPEGLELVLPRTRDELHACAIASAEAFGEPAPGPADADRLAETIAAGGIAVLARSASTAEPAGAGLCTPPADGATELAGIGVREPFRRRGLAGAITARLAREAFATGVTTAFLTPGDEGAFRVYERAGFTPRGEMLHLAAPRNHAARS